MENSNKLIFKPKEYNFKTGVAVTINSEKITAKHSKGTSFINSENIDNLNFKKVLQPKMSVGGMQFRLIGLSLLFLFIMSSFMDTQTQWKVGLPIFFIVAVLNVGFYLFGFIDAMLELKIYRGIINKYFSDEGFNVSIGNKSGNNIDFLTLIDEQNVIEELKKKLEELKLFISNKQEQNNNNQIATSNLDELKKLGDLYKNKIITEDEFEKKKMELLNK